MQTKAIQRGEIYYADLDPVVGSEQGSMRPCLVVQNNVGNKYSPTIVIVPITCQLSKTSIPTHAIIPVYAGLQVDSLALAEQIRTIDRSRIREYIGQIDGEVQSKIDIALAVCVGIEQLLQKIEKVTDKMIALCLCPRCERDFRDSGSLLKKKGWQETKQTCDFCESRPGLVFNIVNVGVGGGNSGRNANDANIVNSTNIISNSDDNGKDKSIINNTDNASNTSNANTDISTNKASKSIPKGEKR